jgi:putative hemolysin
VLIEQGAEAGVFQEHEQAIVSRVFRLDELKVTSVMTPQNDIVYLDLDEQFEMVDMDQHRIDKMLEPISNSLET